MTIVRAVSGPANTPKPVRRLEGKIILVAEDVEINQRLTRHILEGFGATVIIANNGSQALQLAGQHDIHCILMDIQMPEMDGVEATRQIRRIPNPMRAGVPIVALTANTDTNDLQTYADAGMNDYLSKPIDDVTLIGTILKASAESGKEVKYPVIDGPAVFSGVKTEKPYDLTMIRTIAGGDPAFVKKMILLFAETVPVNVRELIECTRKENWLQVSKLAHKLKSTVDSMGIRSLKQDIRTVEANAKQTVNLESIPALVAHIDAEITNCLEQLKAES